MSKRKDALALFALGKKPSDPEVKALGLKPKTCYAYFQDWKKISGKTQSSLTANANEITELKEEKTKLTLLTQIAELKAEKEKLPSRVGKLEKQISALIDYLKEEHENVVSRLDYHAAALGLVAQTIDVSELLGDFKQEWEEKLDKAETEAKQVAQQDNKRLDAIKEGTSW